MDVRLPESEETGRARWPPRSWRPYEDFLTIHDRYMRLLEDEGILLESSLSILQELGAGEVEVSGTLGCRFNVTIRVANTFSVRYRRGQPYVRGEDYNYHAWLGTTGQQIIRYDTAHEEIGLHCHLFDLATGEQAMLPVPWERLPTLNEFVRIADRIAREAQH